MIDLEAIPPFLRLTAEERAAAWKGRKLTIMRNGDVKANYAMPRSADATARSLAREREVTRQTKARARLAALKRKGR